MQHFMESVGMAGGRGPRTPSKPSNPVRRNSKPKGQEGWRPTGPEVHQNVWAAIRFDDDERVRTGKRPLGPFTIRILKVLVGMIDYATGRLDPSIDTLMRNGDPKGPVIFSRATVCRALKRLKNYGFISWIRRCVPTGNVGKGPQIRQTSNAYKLSLPARAARFVGRWCGLIMPDDEAAAQDQRAADKRAADEELTADEVEEIKARLAGKARAASPADCGLTEDEVATIWTKLAVSPDFNASLTSGLKPHPE